MRAAFEQPCQVDVRGGYTHALIGAERAANNVPSALGERSDQPRGRRTVPSAKRVRIARVNSLTLFEATPGMSRRAVAIDYSPFNATTGSRADARRAET